MAVVSNPDNSSSSLNPSVCISGADAVGSKLAVIISQTGHGFTAGSVVRWNSGVNGETAEYVSSQANNAYNAEVSGVVSEVIGANAFQLTLAGTVNMTNWFHNTTGVIPAGIKNDDVYFLSGYTAGWMDNVRPSTNGWVAKPVITRLAEDSQGNIFGSVTNYVGSLLGGNIAVSLNNLIPVGTVQSYLGTNPPDGWSLCDGDGSGGGKDWKGLPITSYPDYKNEVGMRYGWCEALKTDQTSWVIGSRIEQNTGTRVISGIVTGVSADGDNGYQWIYVKQEYNNKIPNNGNFVINKEIDPIGGNMRGSEPLEGATYDYTKNVLENFIHSTDASPASASATYYEDPYDIEGASNTFNIYKEGSGVAGLFSCLVPNMYGRFLMGADASNENANDEDSNELNRVGGIESFPLNFEEGLGGNGIFVADDEATAKMVRQYVLPPHLTVNWIVRNSPNSYAALIDTLEIRNLRLTNLPTDVSSEPQWTVYRETEDNTIKIKAEE
jgi:hypothetical protein